MSWFVRHIPHTQSSALLHLLTRRAAQCGDPGRRAQPTPLTSRAPRGRAVHRQHTTIPIPWPTSHLTSPASTPTCSLSFLQVSSYRYLDGMPELLRRLGAAGYPLHACSNYPAWWRLIEDKLAPSQYLAWSFVSCEGPMKVSMREGAAAGGEGEAVARAPLGSSRGRTRICIMHALHAGSYLRSGLMIYIAIIEGLRKANAASS
mgnify:CR=1 FL=1